MFSSIYNALCTLPSDRSGAGAKQSVDLSRAQFLRLVGTGLVASGVGLSASGMFAQTSVDTAPVTDLDKVYDAWQDRFNAGDLDGLVALYAEDVTYINPDGVELLGNAATRSDYQGLLALKPKIEIGDRIHVVHNDIALSTNHWTLELTDPDGTLQNLTGGGIEVLRNQGDAGWLFIIDDASRSAS
jgi:ketosteroid isomerase-like protein